MRRLLAWARRLAVVLGSSRYERDLSDEIESHPQLHVDDNIGAE